MVYHIENTAGSKRHTTMIVLPEENSSSAAAFLDKRVTGSCSQEVNLVNACRGNICWTGDLVTIFF